MDKNSQAYFSESAYIDNELIDELLAICETDEDRQALKRMGFVKNPYESAVGVLTMAERKVNLLSIERSFSSMEGSFLSEVQTLTNEKKKAYLKDLEKIIQDKDYTALASIKPTMDGDISKKYADAMKQMFETGKKTASDEMQVIAPTTDKDVQGLFRAQALQMEDKISNEMAVTAQSEALYNIAKGVAISVTLEQVEKALDQKLQKIVLASGTQAIGGAFNTWRVAVFEKYKDRVYGFQYTAVIDRRTTNFCLSLNGRVIGADDTDFYRLAPPNHTNCRSFWVEILKDEFIKPQIENIPDSIPRNKTGLTNFQDLQKIIPYSPKSAPTPEEARVQREGVLRMLVTDLRNKGLKLKPLATEAAIATPKVVETAKAVKTPGTYAKATTFQDLHNNAAPYFTKVTGDFKTLKDVEMGNAILEAVHDVKARVPSMTIPELEIKNAKRKANATMSHNLRTNDNVTLTFNSKNMIEKVGSVDPILSERTAKNIAYYNTRIEEFKTKLQAEPDSYIYKQNIKFYEKAISDAQKKSNVWTVSELNTWNDRAKSTAYHELGHAVDNTIGSGYFKYTRRQGEDFGKYEAMAKLESEKMQAMRELRDAAKLDKSMLSEYWKTSNAEAFAEANAAYLMDQKDLLPTSTVMFFDKMYEILATFNP